MTLGGTTGKRIIKVRWGGGGGVERALGYGWGVEPCAGGGGGGKMGDYL